MPSQADIDHVAARVNAIVNRINNNVANNANNGNNVNNANPNIVQMMVLDPPSFEQFSPEVANHDYSDVEHNYFAHERQVATQYFDHLDRMLGASHSLNLYAQNAHVIRQSPAQLNLEMSE